MSEHRQKRTNAAESLEEQVRAYLASLDATYTSLLRSNVVRNAKTGQENTAQHKTEFANLFARSQPATEVEKAVAATMRVLADKHRSNFIRGMFEGRFACVSLLIDGRMIETGLGAENLFSVTLDHAGGVALGPPRPAGGGGGGGGGSGRRRRGRGRRSRRGGRGDAASAEDDSLESLDEDEVAALTAPRDRPVLDDATRRSLLAELDREAAATSEGEDVPEPVAPAPTPAESPPAPAPAAATPVAPSPMPAAATPPATAPSAAPSAAPSPPPSTSPYLAAVTRGAARSAQKPPPAAEPGGDTGVFEEYSYKLGDSGDWASQVEEADKQAAPARPAPRAATSRVPPSPKKSARK